VPRRTRSALLLRRALRQGSLALALVVVFAVVASPASAPAGIRALPRGPIGTRLEQCANREDGTTSAINHCAGNAWISGNLNHNNSVYREGEYVPFRTTITGLLDGRTYTLRIGYDAVESGLHAYDYVGSVNGSAAPGQLIIPCSGVGGTGGSHACGDGPVPRRPSRLAIPKDTRTTFPNGSHPPPRGHFSAWGATLTHAAYFYCAGPPACAPIGVNTPGSVPREIDVTFIAAGDTVVLAWGGHIASVLDWGAGRTFTSSASGSPFHIRLKQIHEEGIEPESTGNQERSLHAAALTPVPSLFSTSVTPTSVTIGQEVIDTATLGGQAGYPVTGVVRFFVCGPAATSPVCSEGGTAVEPPQVVNGNPSASASIPFTPQAAGNYCFRAEYSPGPGALYSPALHTNTTTECFVATLPPTRLTVTKECDPPNDPGLFSLLVDGAPFGAATNVPCGHVEGPHDIAPGTYTVGETAGTGTSLANYTSTIGGDCNTLGEVTLAEGDHAVCEITNTRNPLVDASLTVTKVCVPASDPGLFEVRVDGLPVADLKCGESTTAPVGVAPLTHIVSEAGIPPTNLSDYTTVISGACAADGSITLAPGQAASCTITNTRVPPPTTLRVVKACLPAGDHGRFNLTINGNVAGTGNNVGCGGTTGAVQVSPGTHTVGETGASGTDVADYHHVIGGDCAANGTVTVAAGEQATCLITNVRDPLKPPRVCYTLHVARRMVTVGNVRVLALIHLHGRPIQGVRVYAVGPGVSAVRTTGRTGHALFLLRLSRPGILRLTIRTPFACPPLPAREVGVLAVRTRALSG
jgi:Prealbumin-like fold domain